MSSPDISFLRDEIAEVKGKTIQHDSRIYKIEGHIQQLYTKLISHYQSIRDTPSRLQKLEASVTELSEKIESLDNWKEDSQIKEISSLKKALREERESKKLTKKRISWFLSLIVAGIISIVAEILKRKFAVK